MLDICPDQIDPSSKVLEFHIEEKEKFNKVKTLLTQLERCSHFADSSIVPFRIDVYLKTNKIAVTSEFLFRSYKHYGNFIDLLRINGIALRMPKLQEKTPFTEFTPLIGEIKHENFLQKAFSKLTLK